MHDRYVRACGTSLRGAALATLYSHLLCVAPLLHINCGHVLILVTASTAFTRHLLLKFDLLEKVVLLLLNRMMTTDLGGLLLISGRRHARLEIA